VRSVLRTALGQALADEFAVFAGDDVPVKKPDPAIYQLALERLRVEREETIVIEDSTNGLRAARAAELTCLVTVSDYTTDEDFTGAAAVLSDLGDPGRPMSVIANRDAVPLGDYVTLDDLERILAKRRGHPASRGS
jgi:beta-phosphoglucomutase-like phosphatase (HAD superfamily)